jgi:hypothetical protein
MWQSSHFRPDLSFAELALCNSDECFVLASKCRAADFHIGVGASQFIDSELLCRVCGKPMTIELAKTDEDGKAVHDTCYLARLSKRRD